MWILDLIKQINISRSIKGLLKISLFWRSFFFFNRLGRSQKLYFELIIGAILVVLIPLAISLTINAPKVHAAWFDDNFAYRQKVPVTTHAASESNVYITLAVDTATLTTDKLQADCDDLRFTKLNGQILPYQIVSGCDGGTTSIRVGFDTMATQQLLQVP